MNWVTIIWSMVASACLTLAAMHLLVWSKRRAAWANALFSLTAVGTAAMAFCELWMMWAETPEQFATALRWLHFAAWVIVVTLVGFVRIHLRAGRPWLAWTVCTLRTLSLLLNFLVGQNLNYREVTRLRHIPFFGNSVSVAEGVSNPWMLVGQLSLLLWVVFVADAAITVWRRGDRRQALVVGGSIVFFVLAATVQAVLVLWEIVHWPITASLFYMGIVAAMGYEMTREVFRAAQLSVDLRESEERMTLAAEAVGLGVWIWRIASNRIWGTHRWLRLFGFEPGADVRFEQVLQQIHPDDRETVEREVRRALEDEGDYAGEFRVGLPDGVCRWIAARGRVFPDTHGESARMLGVAIDITERRRSDIEKLELRQDLAHAGRVTMLGQLASSLAHELGQPLGAILRNAEAADLLLQSDSPDIDELRAIMSDIRKDDHRAVHVIDRLRSLLKRRKLESCPIDIGQLVDEVVAVVRFDAASRGIALQTDVPPGLPPVRGDRVHLLQVLLNLLLNGMDAVNSESDNRRHVKIHARLDEKGMIEAAVSDSGHGVPPERLGKLFEPFFTTKEKGMGMGLPISRTIVEAHGGRIWAENNADRGATFRFTLSTAEAGGTA
jgi:two-component system, LuxR family, sensor kinase FixL